MTQFDQGQTVEDTDQVQFVPSDNYSTDHVDAEDVDVDFDGEDDEQEDVPDATDGETKEKTAKPKKEKSRGDLPEGLVTPVGLAKLLTEHGLGGTDENGANKVVPPQVVYSYIKNAPATSPYPGKTVQDSLGKDRDNVVEIEAGLEWWRQKNARAAERRANAAEKAKAAADKAAAKAQEAPTASTEQAGTVVEEAE